VQYEQTQPAPPDGCYHLVLKSHDVDENTDFGNFDRTMLVNKDPATQQVFLCENGTNGVNGCTTDGVNGTVQFDEVFTNQLDPNGLGAYEFTLHYDNLIFSSPVITDSGVLGSTGRPVTCTMSILLETQVHWGCASTGLTPPGPIWAGPKTMAHVVLPMKDTTRGGLYPHKENGIVSRFDDTGTEPANVCGQPLNDGTGFVLPGQTTECQGVLLLGVLPGGLLPDSHSFITIRRLEGDLDKNCVVDINDMQAEATRYGFGLGSLLYDVWYDLEPHTTGADGDIDIKDIQFVFGRFGSRCDAPIPPQTPQTPADP
jgi:hypothetical protein